RVQHLLLPFVALPIFALVLLRRERPRPVLLLVAIAAAVATLALQVGVQAIHPKLAVANRSDALFGAILPAARDPSALVAKLGLPGSCVELTHTTWYLTRGRDAHEECPAAFALGHGRVVATP